jgi:hypothetical protein
MGSTFATIERIEALRALLDRLCAPDLTLAESKVLRCRMFELTGRGDPGTLGFLAQTDSRESTPSPGAGRDQFGDCPPNCHNCAA